MGMIKRGISSSRATEAKGIEYTVGTDMESCPFCKKFFSTKRANGKCPHCKASLR